MIIEITPEDIKNYIKDARDYYVDLINTYEMDADQAERLIYGPEGIFGSDDFEFRGMMESDVFDLLEEADLMDDLRAAQHDLAEELMSHWHRRNSLKDVKLRDCKVVHIGTFGAGKTVSASAWAAAEMERMNVALKNHESPVRHIVVSRQEH